MANVYGIKMKKLDVSGRLVYKAETPLKNANGTDNFATEGVPVPLGYVPTIMYLNETATADATGVGATTLGVFLEGSYDNTNFAAIKRVDYVKAIANAGHVPIVGTYATTGDFPYVRARVKLSTEVTSGAEIFLYILFVPGK